MMSQVDFLKERQKGCGVGEGRRKGRRKKNSEQEYRYTKLNIKYLFRSNIEY